MAASALLLLLVALAVYIVRRNRAKARLPPGPPADPLIGHLRVWPATGAVDKLYEWSKQYGDVMHFNLFGKSVVVLSSREAVSDLLDKRGAIYSNRPFFPTFELLGWTDLLLFQQYGGPDFHKQRKMAQQPFTRQGCLNFRHIQIRQTRTLLKSLLHSPEEFEASLRMFTSAITLEIIYGHKVESADDEFTKIAERSTNTHIEMSKAGILELFPSLRHLPSWFPGAWFIRYAQESQDIKEDLSGKPFEQVRRQLTEGKAQPSFVSMHLEELAREGNDTPEEFRLVKLAAWQIWTAGEETTWATLMTIILAAVMNPEVVKKAQAEIDRVVGTGRLPTFDDEDSLPYVQAFIWEARRWHTVVPLGVPHLVKVDDVYRDMLIPKDTSILINMKALALQENVHKDPHKFWPERYLPGNDEPPPTDFIFGFGRRVCPGRFLADASIWLVTATLLAAFDTLPVQDENGRDLFPSCEFLESLSCHPAPFECRIRPRSKQAEALVAQL